MDFAVGKHRFVYSYFGYTQDADNFRLNLPAARLAEAEFDLEEGKYHTLYFVDDNVEEGAKAAYRVIKVENLQQNSITEGKVNVRFVHLSADAGSIAVKLADSDGNELASGMPENMSFSSASDYIPVDPEGLTQDGGLLFHIYLQGSSQPISVGVPANTGHSFDVLLHGFTKPHTLQLINKVAQNGAPSYKTIQVPVGFTATVRQMY